MEEKLYKLEEINASSALSCLAVEHISYTEKESPYFISNFLQDHRNNFLIFVDLIHENKELGCKWERIDRKNKYQIR